jgi:hypothetical protein
MISLSFDTDHIKEERMVEFLASVPFPGRGTFFCTQFYPSLAASRHETGPHPLLEPGGDWQTELSKMRQMLPDAVGWRSHSCVFSNMLAIWLGKNGYRYVSTHDDFGRPGLKPNRHSWGVWHLPIYYMDTLDLSYRSHWGETAPAPFAPELIQRALGDGLYVFDFHPIHLLLNSPSPEYYMSVRDRFLKGEETSKIRFDGYGVRNYFDELCAAMRKAGLKSVASADALAHYEAESIS